MQRCTGTGPKTSLTAARRALLPSRMTRTPCSMSRPRPTRSASRWTVTVLFSVEPSQSPSGILTPSVLTPSATTQQRPFNSIPSSSNAARRTSEKRTGHQRLQMLAGAGNELAADRRLRRRTLRLSHSLTDGLACAREAAGGNARQHLLEHHTGQRVTISEIRIGRQGHLVLTIGRAGPRTLHSDPSGTQGHLAVLMAVTHRGAPGDRRVLGAHDLVELGLHHLAEHAQPDAHAQREQPLLRGSRQLPQRLPHPQRQTPGTAVLLLHYGLHGGSSRLNGLISHSPRSQRDRTRREDRHLQTPTSYGTTSIPGLAESAVWNQAAICGCWCWFSYSVGVSMFRALWRCGR